MEFWIGAGLASLGLAVGIGQWLVPADRLGSKIRSGLILLAVVLALVGVGLIAYAVVQNNRPTLTAAEETVKPSNEPTTYMGLKEAVPEYPVFQPGQETKIHVFVIGKGPNVAKDVSYGAVLGIRDESITKKQEDEMFGDLTKNIEFGATTDFAVNQENYSTKHTNMLNKRDAEDLQSRRTRLYLVGLIRYHDKNGHYVHEFCQWLHPPIVGLPSTWQLCDGGHNRTISVDASR